MKHYPFGVVFLLFIFYSSTSFAISFMPHYYDLDLSIHMGYSSLSTEKDSSQESRSLLGLGTEIDLSAGWSFFTLGVGIEITKDYQLKDPDKIGGSNSSGLDIGFPLVVGIHLGRYRLIGKYYLSDSYKFDKPYVGEVEQKYQSCDGCYSITVTRYSTARSFWGVVYRKKIFNEIKRDEVITVINDGTKPSLSSFGVIYGLHF